MVAFFCKNCGSPASGSFFGDTVCQECWRTEVRKLKKEVTELIADGELVKVHRDVLQQIFDVAECGAAAITDGDEADYAKRKCEQIASIAEALLKESPVAVPE